MRYSFLLLMVFTICTSQAQLQKAYLRDSARISAAKKVVVEFAPGNTGITLPFNKFIVDDLRFDTGYLVANTIRTASGATTFRKISLKGGISSAIASYLNTSSTTTASSNLSLVCYLKQLRIQQKDSVDSRTAHHKLYNTLFMQLEAYLMTERGYYPALRIDTAIEGITENNTSFTIVKDALNGFIAKASTIDTTRILKRQQYSLQQLNERYQQRFDRSILNAQKLQAGVYKSFRELANNAPSTTAYEFKKDRKVTILYTKNSAGEWMPERSCYGFCDGVTLWINFNSVFHPLARQGNTFEFAADIYYSGRRTSSPGFYIPGSPTLANIGASVLVNAALTSYEDYDAGNSLYQLDMETGEFK